MKRALAGQVLAMLFVSSLMWAGPLPAQTTAAAVSGEITDPNGRVVPGTEVTLTNLNTNVVSETKTNGEGIYRINGLLPGIYRANVTKDGFKSVVKGDIELHVQDNVSINFALEIGSVSETVTVQGGNPNINTTDGAVSTVIDHGFVENMPLNGRSLQDLFSLSPGVEDVGWITSGWGGIPGYSGEMIVNGQRAEANYFTVDGVSATNGAGPGAFGGGPSSSGISGSTEAETALGTTQSTVSVDALQEFRVSTSTYSAEYGRTPGGQFALTTRSGTNDWHGSAYDYVRNEDFDANDWFQAKQGLPKTKERQNDFGGTLGGPFIIPGLYDGKDKTFFFFSYEGLRLWTPQSAGEGAVPDDTLRSTAPAAIQPFLKAFPEPNRGESGLNDGLGLWYAAVSNPSSLDSVSARIDHNFGARLNVFGRYANAPSTSSNIGWATNYYDAINSQSLTLGATAVVSARQTNELRFNLTQSNSFYASNLTTIDGAIPFSITQYPGLGGKPFPLLGSDLSLCVCYDNAGAIDLTNRRNAQRQYNITDSHSIALGRHQLKFGVDWRRLATLQTPALISESVNFFSEQSILINSADSAYVTNQSSAPVEPIYTNFSTYVQDTWKVTPRLTLSYGLRWDINPAPTNGTGPSPYTLNQVTNLATAQLAPAGTPLWHTDWHGLAPRFGLAYQIRTTPGHQTVLRTGFGEFLDLGSNLGSSGFGGVGFVTSTSYSGIPFPLTSQQLTLPPASVAPPYDGEVYAFDPHLKLPYTLEWNLALEQALSNSTTLTVTYVGSAGRDLLKVTDYAPENLGNPNFNANVCGGCLNLTGNNGSSDYDALQVELQGRMTAGLQALVSYTYAHSLDDNSGNFFNAQPLRASSNFDLRHNLQAAMTYDFPKSRENRFWSALIGGSGIDMRVFARTALPVDIHDGFGTFFNQNYDFHPNVVPGQPLYLSEPWAPGGRVINYNAFSLATDADGNLIDGDAGRNYARGFGAWQFNLAIRRDFPIRERLHLQFRAEAFNVLNHPNFGSVTSYWPIGPCSPPPPGQTPFCFGAASTMLSSPVGNGPSGLYGMGGPRSLQLALKLLF